jgi:hypothetical protein
VKKNIRKKIKHIPIRNIIIIKVFLTFFRSKLLVSFWKGLGIHASMLKRQSCKDNDGLYYVITANIY